MRSTRIRRARNTRVRPARNTRIRFGVPVRGLRGVNRRVRSPGLGGNRPSLGNKIQRFQSLNGSLTSSRCAIMSQRPNKQVVALKRVGAPNFLTGQYATRVDAAYGFQEPNSWGLLRTADVVSLVTNPVNIAGTAANIPFRICLDSYIANLTMANASTAPVELEIYDIGLKRDIPSQLAVKGVLNGSGGYVYTCGGDPTSFYSAGAQMANNQAPIAAGVGGAYRNVASSPLDSALFKDYFYVKKRTHVMLSQGGIHRHALFAKVNKVIDNTMFSQFPSPDGTGALSNWTTAFKNVTSFVMVIQKGLPVSDAATAANVTTSDTHVDYILDYRYKWTYVVDNSYAVANTDSLTSPASGQIINVGNGLPEPITYTV